MPRRREALFLAGDPPRHPGPGDWGAPAWNLGVSPDARGMTAPYRSRHCHRRTGERPAPDGGNRLGEERDHEQRRDAAAGSAGRRSLRPASTTARTCRPGLTPWPSSTTPTGASTSTWPCSNRATTPPTWPPPTSAPTSATWRRSGGPRRGASWTWPAAVARCRRGWPTTPPRRWSASTCQLVSSPTPAAGSRAGAGPPCGSSSTTSCTSTSLPSRPSRHPPTRRSAWTPPATCPTGGRRCARSRPGCGQEVVQQAPGACSTAPASWSPGRPITLGVAGGTCPVLGVGWPPWTGCLGRMIMAAR